MSPPVEMSKNRRGGPLFTPKTGLALGYQSGALEDMACFEDFLGAFQRQLHYQVEQMLGRIGEKIRQDETTTLTSPPGGRHLPGLPGNRQRPPTRDLVLPAAVGYRHHRGGQPPGGGRVRV